MDGVLLAFHTDVPGGITKAYRIEVFSGFRLKLHIEKSFRSISVPS